MAKSQKLFQIFEEFTTVLEEQRAEDNALLAKIKQKNMDCTLTRDIVALQLEITRDKCSNSIRQIYDVLVRCEKLEKSITEMKKLFKSVADNE